jgi:hypothetical protein
MRILKKAFLLLLTLNFIRIFVSCGCPDDYDYFRFNQISVSNLDNSGLYAINSTSDSMLYKAVAFQVTVSDSGGYLYTNLPKISDFGFTSAMAMRKCDYPFKPMNPVASLKIKTIYPINGETPENSDVTDQFVISTTSGGNLYISVTDYIAGLANKVYGNPGETFNIILKTEVEHPLARFAIEVTLDNGTLFNTTTRTITILNN